MSKLEKAFIRLNDAIERLEDAAGSVGGRERAMREEAAETVGAALVELRRVSAEMKAQAGEGTGEGGAGEASGDQDTDG